MPEFNQMLSTFGSTVWLFPLESIFGEKTFIQLPNGNFTARTLPKLFEFLGNISIAQHLNSLNQNGFLDFFKPPGVTINAIYGTNVSTLSLMSWNTTNVYNTLPNLVFENGDGTVLEPGLVIHKKWASLQKQPVNDYPIKGLIHALALQNSEAVNIFLSALGLL
eukprot:TRINITY_DN3185_c0_g1_i3.p1 TRINITY_DN3185_c0_g1~~TRINITY_DN3185_c0_g1_i3.p1  ORF type:complete len:164 (-),score=15.49 TRINITY_DN3185_c0_g1_i3:18-509(-)